MGEAEPRDRHRLIDEGQASVNMVAAAPSLRRPVAAIAVDACGAVRRRWRPVLVVYPLIMAFALVYSAEHYAIDILLGWALAAIVMVAIDRFESSRVPPTLPTVPAEADMKAPEGLWRCCLREAVTYYDSCATVVKM